MSKIDNRIVVDLSKCQWAKHYWRNQDGDIRISKPEVPTVHNRKIYEGEKEYNTGKLLIEVAKEMDMLDTWTECTKFKLTANETLIYTGNKAAVMWKAWCEKIFKPYMKKEKK